MTDVVWTFQPHNWHHSGETWMITNGADAVTNISACPDSERASLSRNGSTCAVCEEAGSRAADGVPSSRTIIVSAIVLSCANIVDGGSAEARVISSAKRGSTTLDAEESH